MVTPVSAVMTPTEELAMARPDEDMAQALIKLGNTDPGQVPVMRGQPTHPR